MPAASPMRRLKYPRKGALRMEGPEEVEGKVRMQVGAANVPKQAEPFSLPVIKRADDSQPSAPEPPPNYRPAVGAINRCASCKSFTGPTGQCKKYKTRVDSNYVCDMWEPQQQAAQFKAPAMNFDTPDFSATPDLGDGVKMSSLGRSVAAWERKAASMAGRLTLSGVLGEDGEDVLTAPPSREGTIGSRSRQTPSPTSSGEPSVLHRLLRKTASGRPTAGLRRLLSKIAALPASAPLPGPGGPAGPPPGGGGPPGGGPPGSFKPSVVAGLADPNSQWGVMLQHQKPGPPPPPAPPPPSPDPTKPSPQAALPMQGA